MSDEFKVKVEEIPRRRPRLGNRKRDLLVNQAVNRILGGDASRVAVAAFQSSI